MIFKNAVRMFLFTISTCKTLETNIAKCNQLIADDISDKNTNILSSVNEGDL